MKIPARRAEHSLTESTLSPSQAEPTENTQPPPWPADSTTAIEPKKSSAGQQWAAHGAVHEHPEAREYRESLALRAEQSSTAAISEESQFPDALFSAAALAGDASDN
jgi:hypothetical protein